jgi:tetratricopeptide (TPR) repeat protein
MYEAWRGRALVLLKLGRHGEVVEQLERLLDKSGMRAADWGLHAQALTGLGRFEEALNSFDRQLADDPESASGWTGRGLLLRQCMRFEDAVEALSRATALAPDAADLWLELGATYDLLRESDKALDAYKTAHLKEPGGAKTRLKLAQHLIVRSRCDEALRVIGEPDMSDPAQRSLAFTAVWAYCALDRLEDARAVLSSLLQAGSLKTVDLTNLVPLVSEVSRNRGGGAARRRWITMLVQNFAERGVANYLAFGLAAAIPAFIPPIVSHQDGVEALAAWEAVAGAHPEFELSLRLVKAAVEYRESGDERVLLTLPAEERAILEEILKALASTQEGIIESHTSIRTKKAVKRRKR